MSNQTAGNTHDQFSEIGTPGIEIMSGYINEAYIAELRWPSAGKIYSRLRRSDPETAIVRQVFSAMARGVRFEFSEDPKATDDEKRFSEFGDQVLEDVEGGATDLIQSIADNVPFYGWGWWEALPGVRSPDWQAPDQLDDWRSEFSDGLIGLRRFAFRDPSSFYRWDVDSKTGRLYGMEQNSLYSPVVNIPIDRSLHLTFGDSNNPEGLSPLESIYRLERVKYAYELIAGIGFEHAAGYLEVKSTQNLTPEDKSLIRQMARAIMSAQEANYAAWPSHLSGEIKDIAFAAGSALLEMIRFYHVLKLQLFNMQWASIASTAGTGAYSAASDSSGMFLISYNAMMQGFADQIDAQIGKRLLKWNRDKFPGLVRRPRLRALPVEKIISLTEIGQLIGAVGADNLGPEDWLAIRKATHILPESMPELVSQPATETRTETPNDQDSTDPAEDQVNEAAAMAAKKFRGSGGKSQRPRIVSLSSSDKFGLH
jgi:hypothetical protein